MNISNCDAFFCRSVVLKNLLSLGVELPKVEKDAKASNFLLTCDWQRDIQPYLIYLHQVV